MILAIHSCHVISAIACSILVTTNERNGAASKILQPCAKTIQFNGHLGKSVHDIATKRRVRVILDDFLAPFAYAICVVCVAFDIIAEFRIIRDIHVDFPTGLIWPWLLPMCYFDRELAVTCH